MGSEETKKKKKKTWSSEEKKNEEENRAEKEKAVYPTILQATNLVAAIKLFGSSASIFSLENKKKKNISFLTL